MDDADNTEESAEDITAADTEPSPKKAEIKKPDFIFFSQLVFTFTLELGGVHKLGLQDLSFFDHLPSSVYIFYGI